MARLIQRLKESSSAFDYCSSFSSGLFLTLTTSSNAKSTGAEINDKGGRFWAFLCECALIHTHKPKHTIYTYIHLTAHLREWCCASVSHCVTKTKLGHSPNRGSTLCFYSSRYLSLQENGLFPRLASSVSSLVLQWSDNPLRLHTSVLLKH